MAELDNAMRRQALSLPALMRQQYEDLEPKTRLVLSTPEIFSVQRIILTGCGDSYDAALAAKPMFELLTGIPTEAVSALDLSRYYEAWQLGFAPNNPLVIAVSNSGGVARVREAVEFAHRHGAFTLAVTSNPDSPIGSAADRVLKLDIPEFESAPGVRSYLVSVMALLLLCYRMGEVRGRYTMDTAMSYRLDMLTQADLLEALLPEMDAAVLDVAKRWKDLPAFDFVGAGFDYAAALYGQAKILEATGRYAMQINSEEWLHLNFFLRDAQNIGTVVVSNTTNPGFSRSKEMIGYAARLGRPLMVVSNGGREEHGTDATYIKTPKSQWQYNMPLTQTVPLALLAGYLCELLGEEYGRGCKGPWSFCAGGACVRESELVIRQK